MALLFVDCEFNGFGGQLMSMAVVSDCGKEWYEVLPLPDDIEPWVRNNVVDVMGKRPVSEFEFRMSLFAFLEQFEDPTICADWYTDIVHFFSTFAGKDHSQSHGFACKAELRLIEEYDSKIPHNALSDARAIKEVWLNG